MYLLPRGMRFATLEERREFYSREFSLAKVKSWLGGRNDTVFALIVGRHTNIFPREHRKIRKNTVIVDEYRNLEDFREYILRYLPEGVYYDRNLYASRNACAKCGKSYRSCWDCDKFLGQELAFDIDPENIRCPYHGGVQEKMRRKQGLSFCMLEFNAAKKQTMKLYKELKNQFGEIKAVYSGRGFHLHVFGEAATALSFEERKKLAKKLAKKFAIDEWVTSGEMRLVRLPHSLHGMVSRVCIPLSAKEIENFNPIKDKRCIPGFLTQ